MITPLQSQMCDRMETDMKLALSKAISEIDRYCIEKLGIPMAELMRRSGHAVTEVLRANVPSGTSVVVLAGKGNNGADGYAAACELMCDYDVTVIDIFGIGQKSDAGKQFALNFENRGGKILTYAPTDELSSVIKNSDAVIDAVFGTGFHGEMPEEVRPLAITVRETVEAFKLAVDVPLGINADDGSVSDFAITVDATVELSFIKAGIVSYPARSYVGKVIYDSIGLPVCELEKIFEFNHHLINSDWAEAMLPRRAENSNKGTFGKLLLITGSEKYRGAAHLSSDAALRGGVGLVTFCGTDKLCGELAGKYPEIIYAPLDICAPTAEIIDEVVSLSQRHTATLVGSGSANTNALLSLVLRLLSSKGGPLILDADAINALAGIGYEGIRAIREAKRAVILTPHPLEFSRLSGNDVATVQQNRLELARRFALENKCILVLKGAGTVSTDGETSYINTTGSSALAKAGSGDVLAGLIGALAAQDSLSLMDAAALAVYYHALAGDRLAAELSSYGVTPSDLPREIARCLSEVEKKRAE